MDTDDRTRGIEQLWSEGDYTEVARWFEPISDRLIDQLRPAGMHVLDAATGTGNTALAAARAGAEVDAFDLTEPLLDIARSRAAAEGLAVRFRTGDLLDVPYADASFDLVLSTFGAFTADDPVRAAEELVRVCRPGGTVVSTAWGREGIIATVPQVVRERRPELFPDGAPDPALWAVQAGAEQLFAGCDVDIEVRRVETWFPFPGRDDLMRTFEAVSGPIRRLRGAVGEDWPVIRAEVIERWAAFERPAEAGIELLGVHGEAQVVRRS
ncbi:class I SAM-dependent methyltransferase [Nitriliruptor alkaliphilus]|uniref:class I SAM-dependent methyltransferase n=1 Tax=Nitriliruptor alkaliphilus TaxID=427918 RepID=UPI000695EAB4|nr:class I SAM-dependent methyltransferase [Nitriliruptor alkaliphilus]